MKPASIRFERNQVVRISGHQLRIGDMEVDDTQRVRLKGLRTPLSGSHIRLAASHFHTLAPGGNPPQLSLVAFNLTGEPGALEHYFPLAQGLPPKRRAEFHQVLDRLVAMDQLRITLSGEGKRDRTRALPAGVRHLLAGLILEPLFFRQDLLGAFFTRRKVFKLYTTLQALRDDGGVGGGCYHPGRRIMQLALPRLWEGFDQSLPGVSPFLHEFGHMLDAFDERRLRLDRLDGFLPGMDESASAAFIEGKAIELERYRTCQYQPQPDQARQPLGNPYVFTNDREFLAGYFEMFFRNPHAFASRNPTLYRAFARTLRQDPRDWLKTDFNGYVNANFKVYSSGVELAPPHIHLI